MITQLQKQYSPWQQMLPQFLSNLYFQKTSQKFQTERAEQQRKEQEEDTLRQLQMGGFRESEADIPDVEVAGKGLKAPQTQFEIKTMGGKSFLVQSKKKYGEQEGTPEKMTQITGKEYAPKTVDVFNEKTGMTDIYPLYTNEKGELVRGSSPVGKKAPSGTKLTVDKEGNVTFTTGKQQGSSGLTQTNLTDVQKQIMSNDDRVERVKGIMDTYQEKFTDAWSRLGMSFDAFKEKFDVGKPLSKNETKQLSEYSIWRQNSIKDLTKEIHEFAGGNMTRAERDLKIQELPDPGTRWYNGDSHTVFTSKLINTYKSLEFVNARKKYLLKNGYDQKQIDGMLDSNTVITIDNFKKKVDDAAELKRAELTKKAIEMGADIKDRKVMSEIRKNVLMFLNQEFGFNFKVK